MKDLLVKLNTNTIAHIGLAFVIAGLSSLYSEPGINNALKGIGIHLSGPALGTVLAGIGSILSYLGKPVTANTEVPK